MFNKTQRLILSSLYTAVWVSAIAVRYYNCWPFSMLFIVIMGIASILSWLSYILPAKTLQSEAKRELDRYLMAATNADHSDFPD